MSPVNINDERITYFGQTDSRGKKVNFGIKAKDRTRHVYVIGKTGMGKSTLLENMAVQDIKNGEGMAFIDPHGKTADLLLEYVPASRMKDVVYFAPFDTDYPISFNVLESVDPDKRHLVVSGLMSTFKKIWQDAWSARMEYILTNTLLALLEYPDATLLGVNRMLAEKDFRKDVIDHVTDVSVKNFWIKEFANYTERMAAEAVPAIQNKIGQFTANALIRNMIGQPDSSFNIRELMDSRKILIINLSKGKIGESNANLLGGMLITKIYLAAMSRADVNERTLRTLPNFYLFVDEFQSFANESFADILSEARKYKLNLTIAHQYIEQMEEEVRAAVFGNVGTMIIFRVGAYDAEILEKEFAPAFTAEDIVNLGFTQIYLKLMIDGIGSAPFSATSLPPIPQPEESIVDQVIASSRSQFSHTRAEVEAAINKWHMPVMKAPAPPPASTAKLMTSAAAQASQAPLASTLGPKSFAAPVPKPTPPPQTPSTSPQMPPSLKPPTSKPIQSVPPTPPRQVAPAQPTRPIPPPQTASTPAQPPTTPRKPMQVVQPFKKAFQDVDEERVSIPRSMPHFSQSPSTSSRQSAPLVSSSPVPLTPVSDTAPVVIPLSALAPKQQAQNVQNIQNTQKNPTPKNVADLKNALASIINKSPSEMKPTEIRPTKTPLPKAATDVPEPKKEMVTDKPQEVPKDLLERLLKVD